MTSPLAGEPPRPNDGSPVEADATSIPLELPPDSEGEATPIVFLPESQPLGAARALPPGDRRLYLMDEGCVIRTLKNGEREYCFQQAPGENYFHLLIGGEVYIERGKEKFCLNCALRRGFLSDDRLHWQKGPRETR